MKMCAGLAVQGILLVLASPAAAQDPLVEGGEYTLYGPARAPAEAARPAPADRSPSATREESGSAGRDRIVGTLPIAGNADLNLGILSVAHAGAREQGRRRTDLSREMVPPRSRIAAVGFSLRF